MGITSPGAQDFIDFPGIDLGGIQDPVVEKAFGVIIEFIRRDGVISDQSVQDTAIAVNTAHSVGNGNDHSSVALNNTHRGSNGSDHSFIDQSVTTSAAVEFGSLQLDGGQVVSEIDTDDSMASPSNSNLVTQLAIVTYVDDEIDTLDTNLTVDIDAKMDNTVAALQLLLAALPTSAPATSGFHWNEPGTNVNHTA